MCLTARTRRETTAHRPTVSGTRASTHQIAGVGLAVVTAAAVDATTANAAVVVAGAWLGSLLPDADRAGSRIYRSRRLERRLWSLRVLARIARLPLHFLLVLEHRGVTHSLPACAAASAASALIVALVVPAAAVDVAAGVAIGYLAHIAADACTPSGVTLFAPVSHRGRWLVPPPARIPTGSLREYAFTTVVAVAAGAATAAMTG